MKKTQLYQYNTDEVHPLFVANPSLWPQTEKYLHKKTFYQGEMIFSHGDNAHHLWLVYHGWVKLTRQTPDGKETIIGLCTEGDILGEAALFAGASYPYNAEIIGTEAELASIPSQTLCSIVAKDAHIANNIMSLLNERTSQAQLKLEHMNTMTAAQRLGCFLLRLCHSQSGSNATLHIPIEKHILAAYLGMKPETLSRTQQQLKPIGIEVLGPEISIKNIDQLREFVCGSCSESGNCDAEDNAG